MDGGAWHPRLLFSAEDTVWHVNWSHCGSMLACAHGDNQVERLLPFEFLMINVQVTLWKESLNGEWKCISADEKSD